MGGIFIVSSEFALPLIGANIGGIYLRTAFIRNGPDTPKLASAWLGCRSLLAGEKGDQCQRESNLLGCFPTGEHRLQAGSYKLANERRAWVGGCEFENASGLAPELFTER